MLPRILVAMIVLVTVGCATTPTDRGQSIYDPEAAWQQQKSALNNLRILLFEKKLIDLYMKFVETFKFLF